jgi:probable O-glycosylation ligase (exosortase A-associated)
MVPHRTTYGWLYSFAVNDLIAIATLLSCLIHWKDRAPVAGNRLTSLLLVFFLWTTATTFFAVDFELAYPEWLEFTKSMLLVLLMLLFLNRRHWTIAAVGVFTLSIAFYGVKGGLFTIISGGAHHVWGAQGSSWGANNAVSMAMLMCMPLLFAFGGYFDARSTRFAAIGMAVLCFAALLGTQSRGGLVGLLGVSAVVLIGAKRKLLAMTVILISLPVGIAFMPDSWRERMQTTVNYEEDRSAMGRIEQWYYAIDIANVRPLFGNGFDAFFHQPYYLRYLGEGKTNRAVHSNYFQVLGEQGYIGLSIYLSSLAAFFFAARKGSKRAIEDGDARVGLFLGMAQYSIVGYAVNGLTINMAYLDLYYILVALIILLLALSASDGAQSRKVLNHFKSPKFQNASTIGSHSGT